MPRRRPVSAGVALAVALTLVGGCTDFTADPPPKPVLTGLPDADPEAGRSDPVADPVYPAYGNPALDVLRYQLDLTWTPSQRQLSGTATLTVRVVAPVNELALDFASSYTVDEVTVDGTPATAAWRGNDLVVAAPRALAAQARTTLVVRYHGEPHTVPMPSGRKDFPEGLGLRATPMGEAWTMQEPFGAFTWYPANDQPSDEALYDLAVAVPHGWAAVAHGALVGVDQGADTTTYRWRSVDPVATYLATLAIGRYTQLTDTGPHGLPITYWLREGVDADTYLRPVLRRTPELISYLEQRYGPYPFPTAGVVLVDSVSAMETQQMVTLGSGPGPNRSIDEYAEVLLHELAHQWFGDAVTPRDWRAIWLSEGWAMYTQWQWAVDVEGASDAAWVSWARERDQVSRAQAGPPGNFKADHFGENNVYAGPALMLRALHEQLGDEAFFDLARDWVQTQRNQPVDRALFTSFVNRHTGRDFTVLIDRWLDSPTSPS
jgi:aminopeptidase N